jgi:hypothetical protein
VAAAIPVCLYRLGLLVRSQSIVVLLLWKSKPNSQRCNLACIGLD